MINLSENDRLRARLMRELQFNDPIQAARIEGVVQRWLRYCAKKADSADVVPVVIDSLATGLNDGWL